MSISCKCTLHIIQCLFIFSFSSSSLSIDRLHNGTVLNPALSSTTMGMKPKPQDQQTLNCPRCHSSNTKFCYYNNYSLSQPRHFCKACKRYWTRGGTLRSVPVGGGRRKNKRIKRPPTSTVIPNETAPFSSYDFYQSQFNDVMTSATSVVNFPAEPENLILGGLPETNAMFPFLPCSGTQVKVEQGNNQAENGDPCMDQFGLIDSSGYWSSISAWPDFSGYGSSVTPLI